VLRILRSQPTIAFGVQHIWYMSLCIDDRLVCGFGWDCSLIQTCTPNDHLYRVTYTRCRIDTMKFSWWWANGQPKHAEKRNKHIWKRIVRQVGYLQRLYRDGRSTEHKIVTKIFIYLCMWRHSWRYLANKNFTIL